MLRAKPNKKSSEFTSLGITVDEFAVRTQAGTNISVHGTPSFIDDREPVFVFETILDITGMCTYPAGRAGERYDVTLLGEAEMKGRLKARVADLQKRSKTGAPAFRKYRGETYPVYEAPPPLAYLEKVRGERRWTAWVWLSPQTVSDSLQILSGSKQVYLSIYEEKVARQRRIQHLAIQTTDPANE